MTRNQRNLARLAGRPLSARELQVLRGAANGQSNADIAADLFVTPDTVKTHLQRIMAKLGAHDRAHAVGIAMATHRLRSRDVKAAA